MSDLADTWRFFKKKASEYKWNNRKVCMVDIIPLISSGRAKEITPYQYRIDNKIDVYPMNKKYHNITTGERGRFKNIENLLKII